MTESSGDTEWSTATDAGGCAFALDPDRAAAETGAALDERWACPHAAHPEADHCPFHMAADRRDALGVDDAAVRDAFVAAVGEGGQDTKSFVGARFDDLDLRGRVLDAGDRFAVDLRGATVGELTLAGGAVRHPLLLDGAEIGSVEAEGATFDGRVSAADARVGAATFRRTAWTGRVDWEGARFDEAVTFRDAAFDDRATFADVTFVDATFAEATFDGDAVFRGARFVGDAAFDGTEFAGGANVAVDDADFSGARFEAEAAFEMARFRAASFEDAAFAGPAGFERTAFDRRSTFEGASFEGETAFTRANARGKLSFADATFGGPVTFEEVECEGDAVFERVSFGADASFAGAEFRGGSNLLVEDADFADATFAGDADFHMTRFRYAAFPDATFEGRADFENTEFTRGATFAAAALGPAAFESATFGGEATFADATLGPASFDEAVFDDDASFADLTVEGDASFAGVELRGGANVTADDADFSGARFEGDLGFAGVTVRWGRFDDVTVGGEARFDGVTFERGGSFTGFAADGVDCYRGRFEGETTFADCRLGRARFDETVFDADVSFAAATIEREASFQGVEFRGGANVTVDDADFSDTQLGGRATFRDAGFRSGRFDDAVFEAPPTFDDARFRKRADFGGTAFPATASFHGVEVQSGLSFRPTPRDDRTLFDFRDANLERGEIARATGGDGYYDLTAATLGAVHLVDTGGETPLFDQFRFDNTAFDGFDFSRHRHYLERNRWTIHDLAADFDGFDEEGHRGADAPTAEGSGAADRGTADATADDAGTDGAASVAGETTDAAGATANGAPAANGTEGAAQAPDSPDRTPDRPAASGGRSRRADGGDGSAFPPEDLEATYLKAKNGAAAAGDNHAMSEFFMKEMTYRRAQYADAVRTGGDGALSRPRALVKWLTNAFFSVTCGYGERPSRVILVSTALIAVFSVFFAALGVEMSNTSFGDPVVYSLQSYTSLVLDPPQGSNAAVNVLTALEGFLGGFMIALFVFSLTRSLHR